MLPYNFTGTGAQWIVTPRICTMPFLPCSYGKQTAVVGKVIKLSRSDSWIYSEMDFLIMHDYWKEDNKAQCSSFLS